MNNPRLRRPNRLPHVRLIAVALFLAGSLGWLSAQGRFSANVVGYRDADFFAGSNLIANPFDAGNNTLEHLLAGIPRDSFFVPWNRTNADFGVANDFNGEEGWTDGSATLVQPDGGFLWLPEPIRITFVGEPWPRICLTLPVGPFVTGIFPLYHCGFCSGINTCQMNPPNFTYLLRWDREEQRFVVGNYSVEEGWIPNVPALAPDEAALFYSPVPFSAQSPGTPAVPSVRLLNATRSGSHLRFQFRSATEAHFAVQRAFGVRGTWQTLRTETALPTNGVITVTVPVGANNAAFYRLQTLRLLNPARTEGQFKFRFQTETGVLYRVEKTDSLASGSWQLVLTIEGSGAWVTATDSSATDRTGYYRVEY